MLTHSRILIFGLCLILFALVASSGVRLSAWVISAAESSMEVTNEEPMLKNQVPTKVDKRVFKPAPELRSATWINSNPLTLNQLKGQVVVVEFWTFACYNCKNTLPYLKDWHKKYGDRGLVVIGVHTPELSFERDVANVRNAVRESGIEYPVAIDGDYDNWNRFGVWAWPTWFILDKEGYVRYSHVGEGDYDGSEATIQKLLAE